MVDGCKREPTLDSDADAFYCPHEKPSDSEEMIVKSRPLYKLCEFQGQPKPKNTPSDCYNDVDEAEFACDEKRRFMVWRE
jgi:hypothetical protein